MKILHHRISRKLFFASSRTHSTAVGIAMQIKLRREIEKTKTTAKQQTHANKLRTSFPERSGCTTLHLIEDEVDQKGSLGLLSAPQTSFVPVQKDCESQPFPAKATSFHPAEFREWGARPRSELMVHVNKKI